MTGRGRGAACGRTLGALALGVVISLVAATTAGASEGFGERMAATAAPRSQLESAARLPVPGGGLIHRFRQRVEGLPVLGAEAVIADPPGSPPLLVADATVPRLPPVPMVTVTRAVAIDAARAATGTEALRAVARARLGIDPESSRLVWEVSLPARRPLADFLVTIDARTGEPAAIEDLLRRATATAALFNPNPVVTQGGYEGLRDARDRDSTRLTGLRVGVSLPRITSPRGCLRGIYVDARLGRGAKSVCRPTLDFGGVSRGNDRFEALMAYFHIDRTRAYVESLDLSEGLRREPQRVRANGIREDNSYFSSMTKSITVGTGGVDDGEDADVIVHEYGHSLQDQAVHRFGQSIEAGALGEGFGDYLAAAMSALTTGGVTEADACIFDWDAVSYTDSGCGRRADGNLTRPRAYRRCFDSVHCLGEAWSGALYELRNLLGNDDLGRAVMDRVVLESNFMLVPKSGFREGARALIAADQLLYGGVHAAAIEAEMIERQFCKRSGC